MRGVNDAIGCALRPAAVGPELPRLTIVLEASAQQATEPVVQRRVLDRVHRPECRSFALVAPSGVDGAAAVGERPHRDEGSACGHRWWDVDDEAQT